MPEHGRPSAAGSTRRWWVATVSSASCQAFGAAVADRTCHLFTVSAPAGVGKSRLVEEFLALGHGTVLCGRCLPYGDGIDLLPGRRDGEGGRRPTTSTPPTDE